MLAWKVWYFVAVCGTSVSCSLQPEETHAPNASLKGIVLNGSLWYQCQLYKQKKLMHTMLAWKVWYFVAVCGASVSYTAHLDIWLQMFTPNLHPMSPPFSHIGA